MEEENKDYQEIDESELTVLTAQEFIDICSGELLGNSDYSKYYKKVMVKSEALYLIEINNIKILEPVNPALFFTSFPFSIRITKSVFANTVEFNFLSFEEYMIIENCLFQEEFVTSSSDFAKKIFLSNSLFNKKISFKDCNFSKELNINQCIFSKNLSILLTKFDNRLEVTNSLFHTNFLISNTSVKLAVIDKCSLGKTLTLFNFSSEILIQITSCQITNGLHICNCNSKNLVISESIGNKSIINQISFSASIPTMTVIENTVVNTIELAGCTIGKSSVITVNSIPLNKIEFRKCINQGQVDFVNISPKLEVIKLTYQENGDIQTEIINKESALIIHDSTLGKTQFINSDISLFETIDFKDSIFNEMILLIPNELRFNDSIEYKQQQLGYAQLKQIYQRQGDQLTASNYYALEIEAHRNKLQNENEWRSLPERFTLFLNRWSNNHGTSWELAFGYTVVVTFLSYLLYSFSLGLLIKCSPYCMASMLNPRFWSGLFEFFLPIHRFGFLGVPDTGWSAFIDVVGRIFIGYGIYQTIQAFRKHGRR